MTKIVQRLKYSLQTENLFFPTTLFTPAAGPKRVRSAEKSLINPKLAMSYSDFANLLFSGENVAEMRLS